MEHANTLTHLSQVLQPSRKTVRPAKPRPALAETEYQRSFKGSPPPRAPRYRQTLEHGDTTLFHPENVPPPEEPAKVAEHPRTAGPGKVE